MKPKQPQAELSLAIDPRRGIFKAALLLASVIMLGTLGFSTIEGWPVFDSLYMTVITITTVGFMEIHPLSTAGRLFTMCLIITSLGAVLYSLNTAARAVIEGEFMDLFGRRRLRKMIKNLSGHYIICGHGRMGRIISSELAARGVPFVIIERHIDGSQLAESGTPVLAGDATKDHVLEEAGIGRAKGLITVLPTDAENLYVVLSARGMNPGLMIVARAVEDGAEQKLMRAGANRVVSPYHIGALRIAHSLIKPAVVDFIEYTTQGGSGLGLEMEELAVSEGSELAGRSIAECGIGRELGIIVIAVKKPKSGLIVSPPYDTVMEPGDILVVIGKEDRLGILEHKALRRGQ